VSELDLTPQHFRRLMGLFATGVTVLAVEAPEGIHGMTANAVTSVSLEPLLVLVCIDRRARMHRHVAVGRPYTINILREDQEPVSRYFAGSWGAPQPPEFRFRRWIHGPLLVGALGTVGCVMDRLVDGGDHTIVLSRVTGLYAGEPGRPLTFFGGRYRRLHDEEEAARPPADEWTHESVRLYHDAACWEEAADEA
jgi:flavin reductase (DIM6/NTAB) family NADH-FMN oxidoreductase RutF